MNTSTVNDCYEIGIALSSLSVPKLINQSNLDLWTILINISINTLELLHKSIIQKYRVEF